MNDVQTPPGPTVLGPDLSLPALPGRQGRGGGAGARWEGDVMCSPPAPGGDLRAGLERVNPLVLGEWMAQLAEQTQLHRERLL